MYWSLLADLTHRDASVVLHLWCVDRQNTDVYHLFDWQKYFWVNRREEFIPKCLEVREVVQ